MRSEAQPEVIGAKREANKKTTKTIELLGGKYLYLCDYNHIINAETKDIFFSSGNHQEIEMSDIDITEDLLRRKLVDLPMVILGITENCNLRCKYCIFSDHYEQFRSMTPRQMTVDTATRGIDYIYSLIKNRTNKKFNFGFYGGEPLLNTGLIRHVIERSQETFTGWDLHYNLTSNLTSLTDSTIDFLARYDVSLAVSLDGDQTNHDAKRVFADGTGTHSTVLNNLRRIAGRHPDYFERKISFMAVHSYDLPLSNLLGFSRDNELVRQKSMRFNPVTSYGTDYYTRYPFDAGEKMAEFDQTHHLIAKRKKMGESLSPLENSIDTLLTSATDFLKYRSTSTLAKTCLFDSRLFLDSLGRFHACERMNETMPVGDVETGLDFPRMAGLLKEFQQLIKEACSDCEVRFMCGRCFKPFAAQGTFAIPDTYCENQKRAHVKNLERYIQYREEGLIE